MKIFLIAILLLTFIYLPVSAHHGKDYIEAEGYQTLGKKEILAFWVTNYHVPETNNSNLNHWELEPGILYGFTNHLGLEIHSHIEKEKSETFRYLSTALEARFRLGEENLWFVDPAVSIEYEISATDEPDQLGFRIILGKNSGQLNFTFNLLGNQALDSNGAFETSYVFGVNRRFWKFEKLNLELQGELSGGNEHYVMPSFYLPVTKHLSLKAGGAIGLSPESDDSSLRSAIHLLF